MKNHVLRNIGLRIKAVRLKNKLTQAKLAELVNLDETYISAIERGVYNPSIKTLNKIAKALNIPIKYFFN